MRFEIFLGSQRLVLVGESAIPDQFPRLEFGGVRGFSGVVLRQASFQIRGGANVFLFREIEASKDVDIPLRYWRLRRGNK
jgi:hypothetical protein